MSDWNSKIIEEFRTNDGRVGGPFEGATLLILHTKGRKTGAPRENPLAYRKVGDGYAVFGSKGGAPTHPEWYYNVLANPDVTVEVGTQSIEVKAREAQGDERERIWTDVKAAMPGFGDYERKTDRQIPVIVLEPAS